MLRALAALCLLLTGADHWTTYLCLKSPISGWEVTEANPMADWLFQSAGLMPGLLIDSLITLGAVFFLLVTAALSRTTKACFLSIIVATTGYAVLNNLRAIEAMGLWPGTGA